MIGQGAVERLEDEQDAGTKGAHDLGPCVRDTYRSSYAYTIASTACIGLLTFYLCHVLRSLARGLSFGLMLTMLYTSIYGLLVSEDNALVLGSLMLFCLLATVMFLTRKVDWYKGMVGPVHGKTGMAQTTHD